MSNAGLFSGAAEARATIVKELTPEQKAAVEKRVKEWGNPVQETTTPK